MAILETIENEINAVQNQLIYHNKDPTLNEQWQAHPCLLNLGCKAAAKHLWEAKKQKIWNFVANALQTTGRKINLTALQNLKMMHENVLSKAPATCQMMSSKTGR